MSRHNGTWSKHYRTIWRHPKTNAAVRVLVDAGVPPAYARSVVVGAVLQLSAWALSDGDTGRTDTLSDGLLAAEAWPDACEVKRFSRMADTGALLRRALRSPALPEHPTGYLEVRADGHEYIHDFTDVYEDVIKNRERNRLRPKRHSSTPSPAHSGTRSPTHSPTSSEWIPPRASGSGSGSGSGRGGDPDAEPPPVASLPPETGPGPSGPAASAGSLALASPSDTTAERGYTFTPGAEPTTGPTVATEAHALASLLSEPQPLCAKALAEFCLKRPGATAAWIAEQRGAWTGGAVGVWTWIRWLETRWVDPSKPADRGLPALPAYDPSRVADRERDRLERERQHAEWVAAGKPETHLTRWLREHGAKPPVTAPSDSGVQ